MADRERVVQLRVVHTLPDMDAVAVRRDLPYRDGTDAGALADLYRPAGAGAETLLPAAIFVHGDGLPDWGPPKEWGQYQGWGRLAAASGLAGVTFNHGSSARLTRLHAVGDEVNALIGWVRANGAALGIDADRLGIWACSAGVPYGMRVALQPGAPFIRCAVAYYGLLDLAHLRADLDPPIDAATLREFSALARLESAPRELPPTLVVKAALDNPRINESIDRFVAAAQRLAAPVESHSHEAGQHGFDVLDDDDRSRVIIGRTLDFLRAHLAG